MNVHGMAAGKYSKSAKRKIPPVSVLRVNPVVWRLALNLANGSGSRIQIVSNDTVIVWNHPGVRYGHRTKRQ